MDVPTYPRLLLVTDAAINVAPGLKEKADIVQNAIDVAQVLGIERPKVAILVAVETINPEMPATPDAAALCKMADRKPITGGVLDGPLAFDNAIDEQAARTKKIDSPVARKADILLARRGAGRRGQRSRRAPHQHAGLAGAGVGHPHQRGADDRPPHPASGRVGRRRSAEQGAGIPAPGVACPAVRRKPRARGWDS